jgi:hypothetical protein
MDRDFQWIRKVISSITHFGQIQSAENLIDFYVKKYENSEELIKYSLDFDCSIVSLKKDLVGKKTILEL